MSTDRPQLTVEQVAERTGLTTDQVYRRIHAQQLPARRVRDGKLRFLVDEADLEQFIAADGERAPEMMRASDVAAKIGFTAETVRRMAYAGILPYVRGAGANGHIRIPRQAVDEYLRSSGRAS